MLSSVCPANFALAIAEAPQHFSCQRMLLQRNAPEHASVHMVTTDKAPPWARDRPGETFEADRRIGVIGIATDLFDDVRLVQRTLI
jgi:hypothetical protein